MELPIPPRGTLLAARYGMTTTLLRGILLGCAITVAFVSLAAAQTLKNITAALTRLRAGDYGICHECEEEISEKRLRALPFATTCLSCQGSAEDVELRGRRSGQHRVNLGLRPLIDTDSP